MPRQKGAARRKEREVLGAIKAQHRARLERDIYGPKAKAPPPKITEATRARFGMLVCMVAAYTCATFANGLFAGVLLSGGIHYAAVYTSWWLWASAGLLSLVDPRLGQLAHFAGRVGELAPARSGVQRFYDSINPGHKYEDRHGLQHERLKDAEDDPDARQDCDIWDCTQARRARVKYWSQYSRKITERRERSKARRACAYCDARGTIMAPTFSVCARCRGPRYCSRLCQRAHWIDGHKDVCVRVRG